MCYRFIVAFPLSGIFYSDLQFNFREKKKRSYHEQGMSHFVFHTRPISVANTRTTKCSCLNGVLSHLYSTFTHPRALSITKSESRFLESILPTMQLYYVDGKTEFCFTRHWLLKLILNRNLETTSADSEHVWTITLCILSHKICIRSLFKLYSWRYIVCMGTKKCKLQNQPRSATNSDLCNDLNS